MSLERMLWTAARGLTVGSMLVLEGCAGPPGAFASGSSPENPSQQYSVKIPVNVGSDTSQSYAELIRLSKDSFLVGSVAEAKWGINSSGSLVWAGVQYMREHGCDDLKVTPVDFGTVQVTTNTPDTCLTTLE